MTKEEILTACERRDIHPKQWKGDDHHTDYAPLDKDAELGNILGWYLGGLFIDVEHDKDYFFKTMTSADTWTRVAKALRMHGLRIQDLPETEASA